ncbi:HEXIM1 [Paramuricea clavata]|uniref:HEXIM1, partial n=1 Tax=Paramuricea clavata TaxID=317549 RepID=A0A6S7G7C6_PARCT|nr:HEXIM1 [Paramuricea clavata]
MHFTSLTCFKMSETCLGEDSRVSKRKKTRRGRRWRLEEKRKFINEYMKQRKHRVAPSNTTQFLMEDREKVEPILNLSPSSSVSTDNESREENDFEIYAELDNFNEQFFLKDFETTYRQLHRDNLYSLSKIELLEKVKYLESHRDSLEKERQLCCNSTSGINNSLKEPIGDMSDSLKSEFLQLQKENDSLRQENISLKQSTANDMC